MTTMSAKGVFEQIATDWTMVNRESQSFFDEKEKIQLKTSAAFRLLGSAITVAGAATSLIGVITIPASLFHPASLLASISVVALGALGVRIGLDLIQMGYNIENDGVISQTVGVFQGVWSACQGKKAKEVAATLLYSRFTKGTFFEPLWKSLMMQIDRSS